jgi:L-rhamnose mutarotase
MTATRIGQVIRVRPEVVEEYERIHAAVWPGVLAAIRRANIRDYSIHRYGEFLFATYRHEGDDLAGDLAAMAADPVVKEWWTHTDAMQEPVPERLPGEWWHTIPEVFHTD